MCWFSMLLHQFLSCQQTVAEGLGIEFTGVEFDSVLLLLFATIDGATVVLGKDDSTGRAGACTGGAIVLAVGGMHDTDTFVNHLVNAEGTEGETLATFSAGILVEHGIPCIIAQLSGHSLHLFRPLGNIVGAHLDRLNTQGFEHIIGRTRSEV